MKNLITCITLLIYSLYYSQQSDSITLSKQELQELIREEVQKELHTRLTGEIEKQENINKDFSDQLAFLKGRLKLGGGALLRLGEWDFNQQDISATGQRSDIHSRFWSRFNFYLHTDIALTKEFDFHARIRTGNKQYSFITFGGNTDERFSIMLDEFWLNWKRNNYELQIGRQRAGRIWSSQQGVQFDLPRHDGISALASYTVGSVNITPKLAFFLEDYKNNAAYKDQGKIYGGAVSVQQVKSDLYWIIETGLIQANQLPNKYLNDLVQANDELKYLDGDMASDYSLWTNHLSVSLPQIKNLTFSFDYYNNLKNYKTNPISSRIYDQQGNTSLNDGFDSSSAPDFTKNTQGFIGSISIGDPSVSKSLFFRFSYLYLEKYAAMDYFAQYDFARWASTNLKGPEFNLAYRFNQYLELKSKLYFTEEIKGYKGIDPGYRRKGNRFRIDLNIRF